MNDALARAIEGLRRRIDVFPEDWDARLLLADAYADAGEVAREHGQRWQVEHQRHPSLGEDGWSWVDEVLPVPEGVPMQALRLATGACLVRLNYRTWRTQREAEDAIADALWSLAILETAQAARQRLAEKGFWATAYSMGEDGEVRLH